MQNINFIGQASPTPDDCGGNITPTDNAECTTPDPTTRLHNALDGIQGGTVNERYHLTKAEHDGLVNPLGSFMDLLTNQTADGVKTFLQPPQVPVGVNPTDAVQFSQIQDISITLTGSNGITVSDNSLVQLGGTLIQDTTIDQATFTMLFSNGTVQVDTAPVQANDVVRLADLDYVDSILSGLTLTLVSTHVTVAPGQWRIANIKYSTSSTTTLPLDTQDATLSRFDAVYADTSGTTHILSGTLSLNPDIPAIPSSTVLVGTVLITPTSVTTTQSPITNYVTTNTDQTIGIGTVGRKTFVISPIVPFPDRSGAAINLGYGTANYQPLGNYVIYNQIDSYDFNAWFRPSFGAIDNQAIITNGPNGTEPVIGTTGRSYALINHVSFDRGVQIATNIQPGAYPTNQISWRGLTSLSEDAWLPWYDFYHTGNLDLTTFVSVATPVLVGASTAGYVWTATDTVGSGSWQAATGGGGGGGGVSSIAVATANGISGTSSGGSNPSLTLVLGAITPTSVSTTAGIAINQTSGASIGTFSYGGVSQSSITQDGYYKGAGVYAQSGIADGSLTFSTTGPVISRTSADSSAVLRVQQGSLSSTGDILQLEGHYSSIFSVNVDSTITHSTRKHAATGNATGYKLGGFLTPTANGDTLTALRIAPVFANTTIISWTTLVGGSGYPNGTSIATVTGGTGVGAIAQIVVSSGVITSATILDSGANYTSGDVLTIVSTSGTGGSVTVSGVSSFSGIIPHAIEVVGGSTVLAASTSSYASLIVPSGSYSGTTDGSIWQDGTHIYAYINGAPRQLDQQTGGGTGVSSISIATSGGVSGTSSGGGTPTLTFTLRSAVREVPSGALNGTNTTFGLANAPLTGKEMLFLNGILLNSVDDYTISGATITMLTAPVSTDKLLAFYPY